MHAPPFPPIAAAAAAAAAALTRAALLGAALCAATAAVTAPLASEPPTAAPAVFAEHEVAAPDTDATTSIFALAALGASRWSAMPELGEWPLRRAAAPATRGPPRAALPAVAAAPEPGLYAAVGAALLALWLLARRRPR